MTVNALTPTTSAKLACDASRRCLGRLLAVFWDTTKCLHAAEHNPVNLGNLLKTKYSRKNTVHDSRTVYLLTQNGSEPSKLQKLSIPIRRSKDLL